MPGYWVCFWYQISIRCAVISARMMPGISSTCTMYSRGMKSSPGNSPPKIRNDRYVPTTGIARMMPEVMRRPVPDSRSSGSE